jgi:uncharacterized membrane protein
VRFESQARESEQRDLVKHVIEKVLQEIQDPKLQKEIVSDAVANVEGVFVHLTSTMCNFLTWNSSLALVKQQKI